MKTERQETTEYANRKINAYLESGDYTSALLLASIYTNIRLRSLLTDWVCPSKNKWKKVSEILKFDFVKLIQISGQLKLLDGGERKNLDKLRKKRNSLAHESRLWKAISDKEREEIKQLCESTIQFLERTKY